MAVRLGNPGCITPSVVVPATAVAEQMALNAEASTYADVAVADAVKASCSRVSGVRPRQQDPSRAERLRCNHW
jgi:hypothetical protein